MYEPAHFVESNPDILHALIRAHPLGMLISAVGDDLQANPIPFLLDANWGDKGVLRAHLARANPQVKHLEDGARALVVFQGENAYVTPSWYASKKEHGKVVPTWNYVMVQVRGAVRLLGDAELHAQITALTNAHEQGRPIPWQVSDAPERYVEMQKRAIVGIEIKIEDIRGKWKVSQNRSFQDQAGVAAGFEQDHLAIMAYLVRDKTPRDH